MTLTSPQPTSPSPRFTDAGPSPYRRLVGLALAFAFALAGLTATAATASDATEGQTTSADAAEALAMLAQIEVTTTEAPGYQRSEFGSGWQTIQGCNTRNRVLMRDLSPYTIDEANCHVLTGTLNEPYTGGTISFTRDRPNEVQIDHVVPAAAAWRMGADQWTYQERRAWFNDMDNLLAVDGPTNSSKGDKTLGEWQPANAAFHCDYAIIYIEISYTYDLSLKPEDVNYAEDLLPQC